MKPTRLKSRKAIGALFSHSPVFVNGLRAHFKPHVENSLQVAYSVPKRRFKRAVDRNRIKRLLREAMKNWMEAQTDLPKGQLILICTSKEIPDYAEVQSAVKGIMNKLP